MKILLFLLLLICPAFAQQTVITRPYGTNTTILSSTIANTNVFQTVIPAGNRSSCTFQNKGANDMWVFFGAATSATKSLSIKLASGQSVSCVVGSVVLKDEIAVTGISGEEFYAGQQ